MKNILLVTSALLLAAAPVCAQDEAVSTDAKPVSPQELANLKRSISISRSFISVFNSEKAKPAIKSKLMACMYNNRMAMIAKAAGEIIAKNPSLSDDNPIQLYRAAAAVCGIIYSKNGAAAPGSDGGNADSASGNGR